MSATHLCRELAEVGVTLEAKAGNIRVKAPAGVLTAELRERITTHKPELLALLSDPEAMRDQLLGLAQAEGIPQAVVLVLESADLVGCIGLSEDTLRGYVRGLWRDARMAKGETPAGWTVVAECGGCGPVWLPAGVPEPVLACPWCTHRQNGARLPRPPVRCGGCRHYVPDEINPEAGIGRCGLTGKPSEFPMASHVCGDHRAAVNA